MKKEHPIEYDGAFVTYDAMARLGAETRWSQLEGERAELLARWPHLGGVRKGRPTKDVIAAKKAAVGEKVFTEQRRQKLSKEMRRRWKAGIYAEKVAKARETTPAVATSDIPLPTVVWRDSKPVRPQNWDRDEKRRIARDGGTPRKWKIVAHQLIEARKAARVVHKAEREIGTAPKRRGMTPAQRRAVSERMRAAHARKKAAGLPWRANGSASQYELPTSPYAPQGAE